ncbi:MAG: thiamine pyrophosphate-dependent enzyme [Opitutales bacterium]|nr:thiamine pyrophosphate-dependent enzyme [Opitutales bacterium]
MHPNYRPDIPYPETPEILQKRSLLGQNLDDVESVLPEVYNWMYLSRRTDDRLRDLFRQGLVYGTLAGGQGNEGMAAPIGLLLDREKDVVSFSHRNLASHLIWSDNLCDHLCQYMANSGSPTLGREGNVHHGDPLNRSLPIISHLGPILSSVMGGIDSQRRMGRDAIGIGFFGDGASSTGDIHETMNFAAVLKIPMVFVIENNGYAYSTPTDEQYIIDSLGSRATAYGMEYVTLDISDTADIVSQLNVVFQKTRESGMPIVVEVNTLRLQGHAAYDTCHYLTDDIIEGWKSRDANPILRQKLMDAHGEQPIKEAEEIIDAYLEECIKVSLAQPQIEEQDLEGEQFSNSVHGFQWKQAGKELKNLTFAQALNHAHKMILEESEEALVMGQDIATYGGAFKVTDELYELFGRSKVINTPLAESATVGYGIGLAFNGHRPIIEFQFADFATDATTQICLNAGTFYYRCGAAIPMVMRFPGGGGLTFGSFHSQELEAMYTQFPGLKVLYPSSVQDAFDCMLAAYDSDDPVLLFEHKGLYRGLRDDVTISNDYHHVWKPRMVREGNVATIVSYGFMVGLCEKVCDYLADEYEYDFELIDLRALKPVDLDPIRESVRKTGRLIVVHEARRNTGFGAEVVSQICEELFFDMEAPPLRIGSLDAPVPFAAPLERQYMPTKESITQDILNWLDKIS